MKISVYNKRRKLAQAFHILKVWQNGRFVVPEDRWLELMKLVVPGKSDTCVDLLLKVLDTNGDLTIGTRNIMYYYQCLKTYADLNR